jgi:hypothetical protein
LAGRDGDYERPTLISCGHCDARWTALAAAHCPSCHETFAGTETGFDAHRVDGRCVAPASAGLRPDGGYWLGGDERSPGKVIRLGMREAG